MAVILCYGDSNTHGYDQATGGRFPRDVRWPGVLAAALGPDHQVIEEGLNGRTTIWDDPYMPDRNGRTYLGPCLASHAPVDVVVLMLGTNDTKTFFGRSAPEIAAGAGALLDVIAGSGAGPGGAAPRVLLLAPPPALDATEQGEVWGFGEARAKSLRFPALYRIVAQAGGAAFLDAGVNTEVDPADGIHLTPAGCAQLGRSVAEAVRALL